VLKATVLTNTSKSSTTTSTTPTKTAATTITVVPSTTEATTETAAPNYEKDNESNTLTGDGFGKLQEEEEGVYFQEEEKQEEEIRVIAEKAKSMDILRKIRLPAFVVFYTYTITMTVFPG